MALRLTALTGALLSITLGVLQPAQAETVLERITRTGRVNTVVMNGSLPYSTQLDNRYVGLGL